MKTFISWIWTRLGLCPIWRRITRRRHQSELLALRNARYMGPFAIFPILLTVGMWFFLGGLPNLILFVSSQVLLSFGGGIGETLGFGIGVINQIFALIALFLMIPWFFGWYFIAAGLSLGRNSMADRKEAELVLAIKAAEVP